MESDRVWPVYHSDRPSDCTTVTIKWPSFPETAAREDKSLGEMGKEKKEKRKGRKRQRGEQFETKKHGISF